MSNEPLETPDQRAARVSAFFAGSPSDDVDLDEVLFEAAADAAARVDAHRAVWLVRLSGGSVSEGWIEPEMQRDIVVPLGQEVEAAAGDAAATAKVGLVGIGQGSVVLRYEPKRGSARARENELRYEVSATDAAIRKVTDLHAMLERQAPGAEIASAFKDEKELLTRVRALIEGLDAHNVDLSARWWDSSGEQQAAKLTAIGRAHGRLLFEREESAEEIRLSGMITGLDLDAGITMARSTKRRWHIEAAAEVIQSGTLAIGETAHLIVQRLHEVDRVGVKARDRLVFVRFDTEQVELETFRDYDPIEPSDGQS